jgi:SAM-dependent methyltransferase
MIDRLTRTIRENYDRLAHEYTVHLFDELQHKPLDRELLTRFALQTRGRGTVCEIGCGPGHVTRFLSDLQVPVFGLDLSPTMVAEARRLSPDSNFAKAICWSSISRLAAWPGSSPSMRSSTCPSQQLATAFSEMWRSLEPDGLLLLAFHVGDEIVRPDELWGVPLTMAFYMHSPVKIRENLSAAGFTVEEVIEREPYPDVEHQSRRAYIFARKHAAGAEASDA